ncbi:di/tricarboxylate transporter [Actinophytocola algeriensis]|uniref:Di/tricarboxylate transporter n=1 Tax=Actinophytocola algeriensis TaxID=1768010 RepID=A0A7W7VCM1_9PSEU|nr:di/tricarboxylate transporter [Actinophytocola algeriensis]MBE1472977.1 di/tricarboxylate transporter [Actinophytocola algeriensis]
MNMGAIAFLGAFLLGTLVFDVSEDDLFAGFPGDLFVVLVGVTLLFAIAKGNGTVDWLVHVGVQAVRGRIAFIPWVMFVVTSVLTTVGAVVPGAVAIMAPIGLSFAARHRINPMLMGLLIINGASAGGFSPIAVFGVITNGVVERSGLPGNPGLLWVSSFLFNALLSVAVFFMFGGRELLSRRADGEEQANDTVDQDTEPEPTSGGAPAGRTTVATKTEPDQAVAGLNAQRIVTLAGLLVLVVGALVFDIDVGLLALSIATVICVLFPDDCKGSVGEVAWPTVLLICGVVTYVGIMQTIGTIDMLGESVAGIGVPLLAAFVICLIGGAVSAFASTTGILGALIPLAVPFLLGGEIGAVGMIIALAISSSVVDSSPFSTSGALVVASGGPEVRDRVFRGLMRWGLSMIVVAPALAWTIFVLPGWL